MCKKLDYKALIELLQKAPEDDPLQAAFYAIPLPVSLRNDYLEALKIEAEATGRISHCSRRQCRKSGKCSATHFDGRNHPCGVPWQEETLRSVLMMQVYQAKKAGADISQMSWW